MPAAITRSKVAGEPSMIATRCTIVRTPRAARPEGGGVGHVAADELAVDAFERGAARGLRTSARTLAPLATRSRVT